MKSRRPHHGHLPGTSGVPDTGRVPGRARTPGAPGAPGALGAPGTPGAPGAPRTPGGTLLGVTRADTGDTEAVATLLAGCLVDLPLGRWLVPDPGQRLTVLAGYAALLVERALTAGTVEIVTGRRRRPVAAVGWLPTTGPPVGPGEDPRTLARAVGIWLSRFAALEQARDAAHPPGAPHQHLLFCVVEHAARHHGYGGALLAHHHAVLDTTRTPAHAEATSPHAVRFLHRHGYRPVGRPVGVPAGPHPVLWPMWRDPGPPPHR